MQRFQCNPKENNGRTTVGARSHWAEILFLKIWVLLLLVLSFSAPPRGTEIPQWFAFYLEKLCIAIPMFFALAGFIREKRKDLSTLLKGKCKTSPTTNEESQRNRWLDSLLGFFALTRIAFVLFGIAGYYFATLVPAQYFPDSIEESRLLSSLAYPLTHPIGFLWLLPALLISRLVATIVHIIEKRFFPKLLNSETSFLKLLWALFAVAFALRIIVLAHPIAPEQNMLAWQTAVGNWVYYIGGMLLYRHYPQMRKKKVRLAILVLFHAVLFVRLLLPLPVLCAPIVDTAYNSLLGAVYFLLAFRGAVLIRTRMANIMGLYAEAIGMLAWFLVVSLWPMYRILPESPIVSSSTILLIMLAGVALSTLFLYQLVQLFPESKLPQRLRKARE